MGYDWSITLEQEKAERVRKAFDELSEWGKATERSEAEQYFALHIASYWFFLPEDGQEVWFEDWTMPDGTVRDVLKCEYFETGWPKKGEAMVWNLEIPWLWKVPTTVMTEAKDCFERYGVLEVWWDIVRDGVHASECMDKFWGQEGQKLFGGDVLVKKVKASH